MHFLRNAARDLPSKDQSKTPVKVLFRSRDCYYLTRGGREYRVLSAEKIPRNPPGAAGTQGRKPVASHRVYVPWFPRAISKSLKRNVRPLSRFVWLTLHDFFAWLSRCPWLINQVVIVTTFATGGAAANPSQVLRKNLV
jgi:hypothetical protein